MKIQCISCKGRLRCGREFCPIYARSEAMFKVRDLVTSENFAGSAPAPFVGRVGYPDVNVGILSVPYANPEASWVNDAPRHWAKNNFQIREVIDLRSSMVNSRFKANVKLRNKFLDISKEVGMASKPVEMEFQLKQKPQFRVKMNDVMLPMGPNASLQKADITANPKIDHQVEKVVDDTDFKATGALLQLYGQGKDENFLSRLLSIGNVGVKMQRKLVPTRWSITAVDDMIAKSLIKEVKQYPEMDYSVFFAGYLGNYYLILTFPEKWSYELFESYAPKASWNTSNELQFSTDYEDYFGRKTYADNTAGGYYAARISILEKLKEIKKQGSILALRFITGEYACPLGVWVCREATRKSMSSKPIVFASRELMINYAKEFAKSKFGVDITQLLASSNLLRNVKQQKKLSAFY